LVAAFFVAYFTEDELLGVHVWAGYLVSGLLLFRIVWGFIGNEYARFSNFLCSPLLSIGYIKDPWLSLRCCGLSVGLALRIAASVCLLL
jgi:cytochrome b